MAQWTAFPHPGDYAFDAASLRSRRVAAQRDLERKQRRLRVCRLIQ